MSGSRMETSTVPLYAHTYQQHFGSSSYSIHTAQMIGLLAFHSLAITLGDSLGLGYYSPLYRPNLSTQKLLLYVLPMLPPTLIQAWQHCHHIQPSWYNNSFPPWWQTFLQCLKQPLPAILKSQGSCIISEVLYMRAAFPDHQLTSTHLTDSIHDGGVPQSIWPIQPRLLLHSHCWPQLYCQWPMLLLFCSFFALDCANFTLPFYLYS